MYPLLSALVNLLPAETKNAQDGAGFARQRRATPGRGNFGADLIIAMFSNRGAAGKGKAGPREPSLNVQNDSGSSPRLGQRSYAANSNVKTWKKRFSCGSIDATDTTSCQRQGGGTVRKSSL